ncbi:tRNA (5-methylaminomethyl-2-thiouridine)(34)-methyltransferase MnmD [Gaetbulibacter sp. M240]|uniref:tRNA (5-methylaminomethyl-2-thiouridine)(34)-methyltransferase MnmD n=1 Tax=Gaetbulibacter sp. M240 TaxID=3126511 RepID=UPI00374E4F1E
MKREIIITADGSATIHLPDWNEQYHSKHGAIQEAYHVFIKHGLHHFVGQKMADKDLDITILEIGFGTGLNAFITLLEALKLNCSVRYTGVEAYPVALEDIRRLNYTNKLDVPNLKNVFEQFHEISWDEVHNISETFKLEKQQKFFEDIKDQSRFDLIYFDAFGARVQPELWEVAIFKRMFEALKEKGVLVTYAAKGSVRRAMQEVGFTVERLPGPPGKREMLRATKLL